MADPSVINEWLKKADEDFGFAESVIEDSTFYRRFRRLIPYHLPELSQYDLPDLQDGRGRRRLRDDQDQNLPSRLYKLMERQNESEDV